MDKYVGKKLDGRYEIRELIGIGGMANVYRCYDTVDDREVAIKILKDEYLNNEEFIRRFKNESKAIAVLSHPNIVKVYDVSFGDMIQYIVMEYIDGITLKEYINQQGTLSWKETVHLITQILMALSHAHSKGVVHRDIKPQNMMLLSDGTIKVTDFGIARFSNSTRTMTEQAIGSVHYIAPEQAKGDITDGKTDIYSIGVMMYEMLTGKLPFDGDNAVSVALMHLQVIPEAPRTLNPSIPEGIEEITLKAMQKQPMDRYQSAQDMLTDIERFKMNPSVRFEYKYFNDKQQIKYSDAVSKGKQSRAEEFAQSGKPQEEEKVRHSIAFPIIIGILIAAFITAIFGTVYGMIKNSQNTQVTDIEVPNFIGMTYDEAKTIDSAGDDYVIKGVSEYFPEKEIGEIVEQEPKPGMTVKKGKEITVIYNAPQSEKAVPVTGGQTEDDARNILKKAGFYTIETVTVYSDSVEEGLVVRSYPAEGIVSMTGDTVYLYVSGDQKNKKITVPYLIDSNIDDAVKQLEDLGLNVSKKEVESEKSRGTVVYQSPVAGSLKKGSTVTLKYSKGGIPIIFNLPNDSGKYPLEIKVQTQSSSVVYTVEKYQKSYTVYVPSADGISIYFNGSLYATIDGGQVNIIQPETQPTETEPYIPTVPATDDSIS
ncbi:MAG: Stk1 family PASTA domain-containing Ser/Thr kinase [Oscillospiraceae bacterium]|nr:Stk1 family PASTA domain-containing Ser/Thr kinase [Oscillospiraceae bacterium]